MENKLNKNDLHRPLCVFTNIVYRCGFAGNLDQKAGSLGHF